MHNVITDGAYALLRSKRLIDDVHVSIDGRELTREELDAIPDGTISFEVYQTVRANSPGFLALLPKLTNDALKEVYLKYYEPNASYNRYSPISYNDTLIGQFIPELLKRL